MEERLHDARIQRSSLDARVQRSRLIVDIYYDWSYIQVMKTIAAAKFKEQCLRILDTVGPDGLVITKHGKPVARLMPIEESPAALIGALRGRIKIRGDILSTGVRWNANAQS
jgi:prevent-host-death family protein